MRVTRGLFASLGASGSVTAAGAVALLALSTVIGVRGWPGVASVRLAPKTLVVAQEAAPRDQEAGRASSAARPGHVLAATEPAPRRALAQQHVGAPVRTSGRVPAPRSARPAAVTAAPNASAPPPPPPPAPTRSRGPGATPAPAPATRSPRSAPPRARRSARRLRRPPMWSRAPARPPAAC